MATTPWLLAGSESQAAVPLRSAIADGAITKGDPLQWSGDSTSSLKVKKYAGSDNTGSIIGVAAGTAATTGEVLFYPATDDTIFLAQGTGTINLGLAYGLVTDTCLIDGAETTVQLARVVGTEVIQGTTYYKVICMRNTYTTVA